MKLGQIIDTLSCEEPTKVLANGFDDVMSYRGYYDQIGFSPAKNVTVGLMLELARSADGAAFQGYKGGNYRMNRDTECWLANYGECGKDTPISVEELIAMLMNVSQSSAPAMNPQTDTPESAEAMRHAQKAAEECFEIIGNRVWEFENAERSIARFEAFIQQALSAQQSETALKLQRFEEALKILEADCINLHCALQSTAHMDPNDNRIPAITGAVVTDLGVMAKKAKAALTHPTSNEGEKKV